MKNIYIYYIKRCIMCMYMRMRVCELRMQVPFQACGISVR